jgi:CBS domain-containing protein
MKRTIRNVMTEAPRALASTASIQEAARTMRESGIGDVIVTEGGQVCGIVTDRDIVVRALADGKTDARLGDICSRDLVTASPDDAARDVVALMRSNALRRIVVMDDGKLSGVVSLGDLAIDRDKQSALKDISAATPNT